MFTRLLTFITIILLFLFAANGQHPAVMSQNNQGKLGITVVTNNHQSVINLPFWLTERFVVSPIFGIGYLQNAELDMILGFNTRHYLQVGQLAHYFGIRLGTMLNKPFPEEDINSDTRTDLFAGLTFGAEYYFHRRFSLGIEIQGDFLKSDERSERFNNAGGFGVVVFPALLITYYF